MISAVVFDAFGTVVRIGQRTNPYGALLKEGRRQGLALTSQSTHFVMTADLAFDQLADHLGIELSSSRRLEMNDALGRELASIEPYPDALEAIDRLQDTGVIMGICSNLAQPYGPVVRKAFPHVQCHAFSYDFGVMKPDLGIYLAVCREMGVEARHDDSEEGCDKIRVNDRGLQKVRQRWPQRCGNHGLSSGSIRHGADQQPLAVRQPHHRPQPRRLSSKS